ncbi:MAG: glycosyltransferase family 2 protein [Candidatus Paceibacteria bacterium]
MDQKTTFLNMPTFSIITATYNRPELLERTIQSILSQTISDWELIIIDDSTNNDTANFIKKYNQNAQIIYKKNSKNMGVLFTRDRGLDIAKGTWITFLDDDDYYVNKNSLRHVKKFLNEKFNWFTFDYINRNTVTLTKIKSNENIFNYIDDYLFGKKIRGDMPHFIRNKTINNIRFSANPSHNTEWYFFYQIANTGANFYHINYDLVYQEYLQEGLSKKSNYKQNRKTQKQQFIQICKDGLIFRYGYIIIVRYFINFKLTNKIYNLLKK